MSGRRIDDTTSPRTVLCIGAHPDDCEFSCSGIATKFADNGARVIIVSVTDGRSGHHELSTDEVAAKRRNEAQNAAAIIGAESRVIGAPDGALEPSLEYRHAIIKLAREVKPDLIITNRPNDYHPDHRYTALLIQDSAYMFMVPHVVPEVPPLEYNPIILYWGDFFTYPREIRPDVVVAIDDVHDTKMDMLDAHESQVYEWLPWIDRYPEPVPAEPAERRKWLKRFCGRGPSFADLFRRELIERYGEKIGSGTRHAEVFEICEYGSQPTPAKFETLFRGV